MKGGGLLAGICALDVALMVAAVVLYLGQDRIAPVISYGPDSLTYEEGMDQARLLEGVTAQDERDGDVTESLMVEKVSETSNGNVIITYVAKDRSDNVGKASRTVRAVQEGQDSSDGTKAAAPGGDAESDTEPGTTPQEPEETAGEPETGTETGTGDGTAPMEGQDTGTPGREEPVEDGEDQEDDREANRQPLREENRGGQPEGNARQQESNQPPTISLRTDSLSVQAGSQSVDWNQCIGSLSDDRDSQAQLFSSLVMEGFVDLDTPGEYPVLLYTRDSEGLESARQVVTVKVEEQGAGQ